MVVGFQEKSYPVCSPVEGIPKYYDGILHIKIHFPLDPMGSFWQVFEGLPTGMFSPFRPFPDGFSANPKNPYDIFYFHTISSRSHHQSSHFRCNIVHHPLQMDEMAFIWKNVTDVGLLYR